jgi:hypothetical protein
VEFVQTFSRKDAGSEAGSDASKFIKGLYSLIDMENNGHTAGFRAERWLRKL